MRARVDRPRLLFAVVGGRRRAGLRVGAIGLIVGRADFALRVFFPRDGVFGSQPSSERWFVSPSFILRARRVVRFAGMSAFLSKPLP